MDLTNPSNWAVIFEGSAEIDSTNLYKNLRDRISSLKPMKFSLGSPICTISTTSNQVKPSWNTGCFLRASQLIGGVKTQVYSRRCILNKSTLINIPYFGVIPYEIELVFPYWIAGQMQVTARQFIDQSGRYLPVSDQVLYSAVEVVEQRVNELSQKRVLDVQIIQEP